MWFFFLFLFFLTEAGSRRKAGVMGSCVQALTDSAREKKTLNT